VNFTGRSRQTGIFSHAFKGQNFSVTAGDFTQQKPNVIFSLWYTVLQWSKSDNVKLLNGLGASQHLGRLSVPCNTKKDVTFK
jgi:hypothetical protein